jgi:hypothetical protein
MVEFLRQAYGHQLTVLFRLIALRVLRRGEAAGLRRGGDLDLDASGVLAGYDGSIWTHHDGSIWPHLAAS